MLELSTLLAFLLLNLAAAWSDLTRFTIPNWISAALFLGFGVDYLTHPSGDLWIGHVLPAAVLFCSGFALFCAGGIGGGDVKYWGAGSLWVGMELFPLHLLAVSMSGLVLAGVAALLRTVHEARPDLFGTAIRTHKLLQRGAPIPYGVAIAFGLIIVAPEMVTFSPFFGVK